MMFASCGAKMSPEAAKAWSKVKELAPALTSMEGLAQFQTAEEWNAAVQNFNAAVQEMGKYDGQFPKEVADSFLNITKQFEETSMAAAANIQAQAEAAAAAAQAEAEAVEGEAEEMVEE